MSLLSQAKFIVGLRSVSVALPLASFFSTGYTYERWEKICYYAKKNISENLCVACAQIRAFLMAYELNIKHQQRLEDS